MYETEVSRLSPIFSRYDLHCAHIGSTAIPGVVAKPIVDIMVGFKSFPVPKTLINALESSGYEFSEISAQGNRYYLIQRARNNFNIQIVKYRDTLWCNNLFFRDYLRTLEQKVKEYGELKQRIINSGTLTLVEYSRLKHDFIDSVLRLNDR